MSRIVGVNIRKKVCDALGLDVKRVNSIIIKIETDDFIRVEVTQLVDEEELDKTIEVLKEYYLLVEINEYNQKNKDCHLP